MVRNNGKIVGILGTVIIHLTAAIIFMTYKLGELKTKEQEIQKFEIEFEAVRERIEQQPLPTYADNPSAVTVENVLRNDPEMLNIARNLAARSEVKIDPQDYINMVKDELIESGRLGTDNYIDSRRQGYQPAQGEEIAVNDKADEKNKAEVKEDKASEAERMAANFQGPTRIYYDLAGRNHIFLPLPIYKCEGSGKVVLVIEVNQRGYVERTTIAQAESTATDECLVESAIGTAMRSRFESKLDGPKIQKGLLTYIFVAQ
ncbi:MAG TPA: hypothetical protein PK727_00865 [Bacteroidales bacterium]|nr:hypothetical protein [Bacteroidales bacterium]HNY52003.1 hypothetical protein [Bacteroidales bacterium]HOG55858.1 hypothetical protein [Bacteroidales bacterium]HPV16878.1 hypothetical protein [Bacteroidales bacterium]HPX42917.1 hypothetical protein [Bacteroidales bacterium]